MNTLKNDTRNGYCSRQADKFVLRFQNEDRMRAAELARKRYLSMNSYLVRAIEGFLDGVERQERLIGLLKTQVTQVSYKSRITSDSEEIDRFVIRMPEGARARIQQVAKSRMLSMNTLLVQILRRQMALDEELDALMDSLVCERLKHREHESA